MILTFPQPTMDDLAGKSYKATNRCKVASQLAVVEITSQYYMLINRPAISTDLDKFSAHHTASGSQDLVVVLPGETSLQSFPLQHPRALEDKSRGIGLTFWCRRGRWLKGCLKP